MSWANVREIISEERRAFESNGPIEFRQESAFETQSSAMLASYLKTKPRVDSALTRFAKTLEWPRLSSTEKFFIASRLDFALEVVSIFNASHDGGPVIQFPVPTFCSQSNLLEWLLVDAWPLGCDRFLQNQKRNAVSSLRTLTLFNRSEGTITEQVA